MGKRGPKPKVLTQEQVADIQKMAAYLNQEQIADYLGITRPTFHAIMKRDEAVSDAFRKGKATAIAAIAQSLIQSARDGNTAAQVFFLKTQAGWRETMVVDNTSSDGTMTPKPTLDLSKLSPAALAELGRLSDDADD